MIALARTLSAALAAAILVPSPAAAQDLTGQPSGKARGEAVNDAAPGMDYHEVRDRLIDVGWVPARFTDPARCSGRSVCRAYPEAKDCAGTGLGPCLLVFFAPGWNGFTRVVLVATQGEEQEGSRPLGKDLQVTALTWATRQQAREVAAFYKP